MQPSLHRVIAAHSRIVNLQGTPLPVGQNVMPLGQHSTDVGYVSFGYTSGQSWENNWGVIQKSQFNSNSVSVN